MRPSSSSGIERKKDDDDWGVQIRACEVLAQVGGTLLQAEDELASVNMIIGASYGGVPALTATSGPGLCRDRYGLGRCRGAAPGDASAAQHDGRRGGGSAARSLCQRDLGRSGGRGLCATRRDGPRRRTADAD